MTEAPVANVIERIESEARSITPTRALLVVVACVPFVLGWLVGIVVRGAWWALAWAISATRVGYRSARGPQRGGG